MDIAEAAEQTNKTLTKINSVRERAEARISEVEQAIEDLIKLEQEIEKKIAQVRSLKNMPAEDLERFIASSNNKVALKIQAMRDKLDKIKGAVQDWVNEKTEAAHAWREKATKTIQDQVKRQAATAQATLNSFGLPPELVQKAIDAAVEQANKAQNEITSMVDEGVEVLEDVNNMTQSI